MMATSFPAYAVPSSRGTAATRPDPGITATTLWQQTVGGTDVVMRELHFPPHTSNGWHYHDGPVQATVVSGTLSHYAADCHRDGVYGPDQVIDEPGGPGDVHTGRNLGDTEVVLRVLYRVPHGKPLSEDAPNPGCPFE